MAGCHTLIRSNNELIGDQAELKFFELTKWRYSDVEKTAISPNKKLTIKILKVNQFKSELKRMSTICLIE